MKHALIVAERQIGKSTLIQKVISEMGLPVFGYFSKKEDSLADEQNGSPVYIYSAGEKVVPGNGILLGYCKKHHFTSRTEGFDEFAPRLLNPEEGKLIVLDEIGFMESNSMPFRSAILKLLESPNPLIAAVKPDDFPFLNEVRSHPMCRCFFMNEENRNRITQEVMDWLK